MEKLVWNRCGERMNGSVALMTSLLNSTFLEFYRSTNLVYSDKSFDYTLVCRYTYLTLFSFVQ